MKTEQSKKVSLKQAVIAQYSQFSLCDQKIHALQRSLRFWKIRRYGTHTGTAIFLGAAVLLLIYELGSVEQESIAMQVLNDHYLPHRTEISSSDFDQMKQHFDFIKPVNTILSGNWVILGGRKCVVHKINSVQLFVKNMDTGTVESLYQVPMNNRLRAALINNASYVQKFGETYIMMSVHDGVLFAHTKTY